MGVLEQRFLRQFREDGDGYVMVRRGREVRFSPTEVSGFLQEWRRLWRAPWLWTGWLILGVIAPAWVAWNGYTTGAFVLGLLLNLFVIVVLIPAWQKPGEVAESRLPFEADSERPRPATWPPTWWQLGLYGFLMLMNGVDVARTGGSDLSEWNPFLLWVGLFATFGWQLYRYKKDGVELQMPEPVGLSIMVATGAAIVTLTVLNPNRGFLDLMLAWSMAALLIYLAGTAIWKRVRPKPYAA